MQLQKVEKNIVNILLYIYVITSLIIPTAIINKCIFIILFAIILKQMTLKMKVYIQTISPIIILLIFTFGFFNSYLMDSNHKLAFQFLLSIFTLFLIYLIDDYDIDFTKIVKIGGVILAITTICFYLVYNFNNNFFFTNTLFKFIYENSSTAIGNRGFFGETKLFFHLGTVPFLVLSSCLYIKDYLEIRNKRHIIIVLLMLYTIILSSSRALVIAFILGVFVLLIYYNKGFNKILIFIFTLLISIIIMTYLLLNTTVFNPNEYSNSVKIGHIISFYDNINIKNIFIGDGLASIYYSKGVNKNTAHTEITLTDMFRYFGFFLTIILYLSLLFPVTKLYAYKDEGFISLLLFMIYLIISLTNPVLFNSFGLLVVLWYWSIILKRNREVLI